MLQYIQQEGADKYPSIKPVSDLRNYNEVLRDVEGGEPVFLTKNGRGRYVILDMEEYEKITATMKLMSELEKGERSAREKGWIDFSESRRSLLMTYRIEVTNDARNDLRQIREYISVELGNENSA